MSSRSQTGSEAKYYALTKKLQRVRAEVLKEQREVAALQQAEEGKRQVSQEKEEHRRRFHR